MSTALQRLQGFGFWIQGAELHFAGLESRVSGFELRVSGGQEPVREAGERPGPTRQSTRPRSSAPYSAHRKRSEHASGLGRKTFPK